MNKVISWGSEMILPLSVRRSCQSEKITMKVEGSEQRESGETLRKVPLRFHKTDLDFTFLCQRGIVPEK